MKYRSCSTSLAPGAWLPPLEGLSLGPATLIAHCLVSQRMIRGDKTEDVRLRVQLNSGSSLQGHRVDRGGHGGDRGLLR